MIDLDDDDDVSLHKATRDLLSDDFSQRLKCVTQLTGLSDAVYAEAYVTVHSYDVMLDLLLINQTAEPMYNLCVAPGHDVQTGSQCWHCRTCTLSPLLKCS